MNKTSISWCLGPDGAPGFTWNPFVGCKPISTGCANCYAARLASTRLAHLPAYQGLAHMRHVADGRDGKGYRDIPTWTSGVRFFADKLAEPLLRRKPSGVFVGDMGDIALLTNEQIAAIFGVMAACPQHLFYVLTKRPGRLREWFEWIGSRDSGKLMRTLGDAAEIAGVYKCGRNGLSPWNGTGYDWPLCNVFVGTSVCTQADADKNISELLQIPAAVRFLSVEPLLEEVDLREALEEEGYESGGPQGWIQTREHGVDWVIIGGESGPRARPMHLEWMRSLNRQCREAGVPAWNKQLGSHAVVIRPGITHESPIWKTRDRAGAEMAEWPEDLRIREMPKVLS